MKKGTGTVVAGIAGAAISGKPGFFDEPDFGDEPMIPGGPKSQLVFMEDEIAGMSFCELAERAMWFALKGQRGTAQRILAHDFNHKIILERMKIEETARAQEALVKRAFAALDADA